MKKSMTPVRIDNLMTKLRDNKSIIMNQVRKTMKKDTLRYLKKFLFAVPLV